MTIDLNQKFNDIAWEVANAVDGAMMWYSVSTNRYIAHNTCVRTTLGGVQ